MENIIEVRNLHKTYLSRRGSAVALNDVSLTVERGEILGIVGFSGAGKSTLVRCLNLLERPNDGEVIFDGQNLAALGNGDLRKVRRRIGMVFQSFNLLSRRTALANVLFPLEIARTPKAEARRLAAELLDKVGLSDKLNAYPSELSGGQKQRVAIARALATDPDVLLCDEVTSALDGETAASVLDLLVKINRERGITLIVITHQLEVVERICDRVVVLDGGAIKETGRVKDVFGSLTVARLRNACSAYREAE